MAEDNAKPIQVVFRKRADRIGVTMASRLPIFANWRPGEPCREFVHNVSGGLILLQYQRISVPGCWIEFGNVAPSGTANTRYGPETLLKAEDLGSVSTIFYNKHGVKPIEITYRDLFAKTDSKETTQSEGESTKISIEATQTIEGFAEFKESVEQDVHSEFSEVQGTQITNELEGEEGTIVPVGVDLQVTETRQRADTQLEAFSDAQFSFNLKVGYHDHRWNHGWHKGTASWATWQEFEDVIKGDAADNIDLAGSFKRHRPPHYDLAVLDPLDGQVKFSVKFEGKIIKTYTPLPIDGTGTLYDRDKHAIRAS